MNDRTSLLGILKDGTFWLVVLLSAAIGLALGEMAWYAIWSVWKLLKG